MPGGSEPGDCREGQIKIKNIYKKERAYGKRGTEKADFVGIYSVVLCDVCVMLFGGKVGRRRAG